MGNCENQVNATYVGLENTIFKQMTVQGQSFFTASGDYGAFCDAYQGNHKLIVGDPSQPFITSVGGTTLESVNGDETAWWSLSKGHHYGGGGGISQFWSIPSWQVPVMTAATLGSLTMRNIPDVSLNANPFIMPYSIFYNGAWALFGGTSCASPIWAALLHWQMNDVIL
jgi:kumamolisin